MILDPADFRALVSGERRGLGAATVRGLLRIAETPYALAMRWRNFRYDAGRAPIAQLDAPVISIGNLTMGGTGKTPLVEWIARWLRARDIRVTLVSRGYGAEQGQRNDEALELEQRLPDVPHLQNRDRVDAAKTAIEEFACQVVLLDDAFQHRRLARDLDIVLLDASEPFGFGHVFPRGMLREPLVGLRRADVVVLSRADMVDEPARQRIRRVVERYAPHAAWAEVTHAPQRLLSADGSEEPLAVLAGQRVAAFCGLGNPAGFRHTLEQCGARIEDFRAFPDHHPYARADVDALEQWAQRVDVMSVVCTHKDLVKLGIERLGGKRLWALQVGVEFLAGQREIEEQLSALLPPADLV